MSAGRRYIKPAIVPAILVLGMVVAWFSWQHRAGKERILQTSRLQCEHALIRRDLVSAAEHLTRCQSLAPDSPTTYLHAARLARLTARVNDAEQILIAWERQHGRSPDITLEHALLKASYQECDATLEWYLLSRAHGTGRDRVCILEVLGDAYRRSYRLPEAKACFDQCLALQAENVAALVARAWLWKRIHQDARARADLEQAVAVNPDHDVAGQRLAELLLEKRLGAPNEAERHFQQLHARQPNNPVVLLGLARCRRALGDLDAALVFLEPLISSDQPDFHALIERGQIAMELAQPTEAIEWLRRAAEKAPHNREAQYNLAVCHQQLGNKDLAARCQWEVARIEADLKRLEELIQTLAVGQADDVPARIEIGRILLRHDREEEGLRWLSMVLQADQRNRAAHEELVNYYERKGMQSQAQSHREMLACIPSSAAVRPTKGFLP